MIIEPISIGILSGIGIACGVAIYFMGKILPKESEEMALTNRVTEVLPGMNCGACGKPGCFAFAQEVSKDPKYILDKPCMTLLQDTEAIGDIENILDIELDASGMAKIATVRCQGASDVIVDYEGIGTCKAAAQVVGGYKECPFGCLGLGDCNVVCPQDAIAIDPVKNVAVIDPELCVGCGLCVDECPRALIELVSDKQYQFLACRYSPMKPIPSRGRCDNACIHCRKCMRACKYDAITWDKVNNFPVVDIEKCTGCYDCIEACPKDALVVIKKLDPDIEKIKSKGTEKKAKCC